MDTPIYAELQEKLTDPEVNNWGPSAPPEFVEELTEHAEESKAEKTARKNSSGRSGGRRHRAED